MNIDLTMHKKINKIKTKQKGVMYFITKKRVKITKKILSSQAKNYLQKHLKIFNHYWKICIHFSDFEYLRIFNHVYISIKLLLDKMFIGPKQFGHLISLLSNPSLLGDWCTMKTSLLEVALFPKCAVVVQTKLRHLFTYFLSALFQLSFGPGFLCSQSQSTFCFCWWYVEIVW